MSNEKFDLRGFSLEFRNSRRVVVLGASGSGKTYFLNALTTKIANLAHIPVLIVDTKREEKFRKTKLLDSQWINYPKPLKRRITEIALGNEVLRDYRVVEFGAAVAWTIGSCTLYVEEIVEHVGKNSVNFPQSNPLLYKLLQQGRERKCSVIIATQRVAQLNLSFVDEATDIFVFQINSREAKFVEDNFRLPQNSLDFQNKKQFGFYYISGGQDPKWFDPIKVEYNKSDENISNE